MSTFNILPEGFRPDLIKQSLSQQMLQVSHNTKVINSHEDEVHELMMQQSNGRLPKPDQDFKAKVVVKKSRVESSS